MFLSVPSIQSLASGLPPEVQQKLRSALAALDKFNTDVASIVLNLNQWTWATPQLLNGWKNFSTSLPVRYAQLSSGLVVISGAMTTGTIGSIAFYLPQSMRPDQDVNMAIDTATVTGYGSLKVTSDGAVTPTRGSNAYLSVDASFLPAQEAT